MRKRLKRKRRSCALCKPQKMSGAPRWSDRELMLLREFERDRERWLRRSRD
jgi:hypothetical protein